MPDHSEHQKEVLAAVLQWHWSRIALRAYDLNSRSLSTRILLSPTGEFNLHQATSLVSLMYGAILTLSACIEYSYLMLTAHLWCICNPNKSWPVHQESANKHECSVYMGNMDVPTQNNQPIKMPMGTYEFGANLANSTVNRLMPIITIEPSQASCIGIVLLFSHSVVSWYIQCSSMPSWLKTTLLHCFIPDCILLPRTQD